MVAKIYIDSYRKKINEPCLTINVIKTFAKFRLRKRSHRNINFQEITLIASPFGTNSLSSEHARNTHAYHHLMLNCKSLFSSKERIRQYYQHVPGQYNEFLVTLLAAICKRLPLDI